MSNPAARASVSHPTDKAARDRETAALKRVKTTTGFVADHVMAWAKTHPDDPDVP